MVSHVSSQEDEDISGVQSSSGLLSANGVSNEKRMLDPVHVYRQGVMPHELRELLQSRGEGELQLISKPAPLPPITGTGDKTAPTQSEIYHHDPTVVDSTYGIGGHTELSTRLRGPHPQHRHFILAKAQGLSSAPSTVRVLHYSPQQQGLREEGETGLESEDVEIEEQGTLEGALLVRETVGRKDSALQELHQR